MYRVKQKLNEAGLSELEDGRLLVKASVRVWIGAAMKPRTKSKTVPADTPIEEIRKLRQEMKEELLAEYERRNPHRDPAQPITTVADYAALCWMPNKMARNRKKSVLERYERDLSHHILPDLGHIRLDELTREHLEAFAAKLEKATQPNGEVYSIPTLKGWWSLLVSMLLDAFASGHLIIDITKRVKGPEWQEAHRARGLVREQRTLSGDQVAEVLDIVRETNPDRYAEIATVALTGGRIGEVYALDWDNVDLDNAVLRIESSVWRGHKGTTKTGAVRETALPEHVVETLRSHRLWLQAECPRGWASGLVFPSTKGTHRTQGSLTKVFKAVMLHTSHDIRVNCQVLRRTWNTLLRGADVDKNVIQAMMGHSDDRMTKLYDGVPIKDKQDAARRVSAQLVHPVESARQDAPELAPSGPHFDEDYQ